ncbi:MAG: hypothetical protein ACD_69C00020G0003 [uncultured bacterium]|nr:MAG: hypothetical protein ACD_69C00020G0003 [uncultured bacterium]
MSRPLRILYENAWYHVMNRGAARATTFYNDEDYQSLVNLFQKLHDRYHFEIHAYCIMPNHYHILIRTPLPNLSDGMRHLNSLYTKHCNKKYSKDGALFRGRYKAILVDADNYLLHVSRYIHLNPIKARLVKQPGEYLWSSCRFYSNPITTPNWLYTNEILSRFGDSQQKDKYSSFLMEKPDQDLEKFYNKIKLLPILGSKQFRNSISQIALTEASQTKDIPDHKKVIPFPTLQKICDIVAKFYHVPIESLYTIKRPKRNQPRTIAIYLAAELSGTKFNIIAEFFKNIRNSSISQIICRVNRLKKIDCSINNDITNLKKLIQN